jgi:NAD(P)H-hydrate epimerase
MIPVLTAAEMREADRRTIEAGLPGAVLMENAGAAVAEVVRARYRGSKPLILCGKGNNGGDGFVVARRLYDLDPVVVLVGARGEVKGDALLHLVAFERRGGRVAEVRDTGAWEGIQGDVRRAGVVVDALLGTGLREEPAGLVAEVIEDVNAWTGVGATPVVAVDVPSGVSSDTGEVAWETLSAAVTVTFGAPKVGHVLPPACDRCGTLIVADIGIPASLLAPPEQNLFLLEASDVAARYEKRPPSAHKGDYGHVLVVAGSVGKTGAAVLAATGALRAGVGLVTVATPAPALPIVAASRPEVMTEALPATAAGTFDAGGVERALELAAARDAVVLGPGLGLDPATRAFVRAFVLQCAVPLVVDADGLNALAPTPETPNTASLLRRAAPTVVTPHPGEMARLVVRKVADVQAARLATARGFAADTGAIVVLKGQRTIVAHPDGRAAVNPTGNPGLATGGTGDVLAGTIGALLARGADAWRAAGACAYLHGHAGDRAAARLGEESLIAGDLLDELPAALRSLAARG